MPRRNSIYGASQISQKPRAEQITSPGGTATGSREIPLIGGAGGLEDGLSEKDLPRREPYIWRQPNIAEAESNASLLVIAGGIGVKMRKYCYFCLRYG